MGVWVRELAGRAQVNSAMQVWTAGMCIGDKDVDKKVPPIAQEMGLSKQLVDELKKHEAHDLTEEHRNTDLLVWITDPDRANEIENGVSLAERMRGEAKRLGAVLLIIPEPDRPWEAMDRGAPDEEVEQLYREQAVSLRNWASIIHAFVPRNPQTDRRRNG